MDDQRIMDTAVCYDRNAAASCLRDWGDLDHSEHMARIVSYLKNDTRGFVMMEVEGNQRRKMGALCTVICSQGVYLLIECRKI